MRRFFMFICVAISIGHAALASDSTRIFPLPDSVKSIAFAANLKVTAVTGKREVACGIKTPLVTLSLEAEKGKRKVDFDFPEDAEVVATGVGVDATEKGELEWAYPWQTDSTYTLLIVTASDSSSILYSAYLWLPEKLNWKLIGTCKINGAAQGITAPAFFETRTKRASVQTTVSEVWAQRNGGSWKALSNTTKTPIINTMPNVDSLAMVEPENRLIAAAASGATALKNVEGVYYELLEQGTGKQVLLTDSVTVHYKGYLLNGQIFDQTGSKPATFPLSRLIKGWQLTIPLCRVGGKIKVYIPSGQAYGIRTRSSKIPPNSVLVFEITVVDAIATKP